MSSTAEARRGAQCRLASRGQVVGVPTSHTLRVTGELLVYRTFEAGTGERGESNAYWACDRHRNRFVLIDREELNAEYGPEDHLAGLHLAGNWVLAKIEESLVYLATCEKYSQEPCGSASETLESVDVAIGLSGKLKDLNHSGGSGAVTEYVVSEHGAVAWLQPAQGERQYSLYGCLANRRRRGLACKSILIAQGSISPRSLSAHGTLVSWTAAGQPHSATV
jgi:hypothetical protein